MKGTAASVSSPKHLWALREYLRDFILIAEEIPCEQIICPFPCMGHAGCIGIMHQNTGNTSSTETGSLNGTASQEGQEDHNEAVPPVSSDTNVLIAYFSRVGNTDFPEDVDAVSSASLLRKDGALYGNTQYVAALIQQAAGGDLFLIETEEKYPADYDATDKQGAKESKENSHK